MAQNERKRALIKKVAEETGNTQKYTGMVVQNFLDQIMEELGRGNRLEFRGFGVFEVVHRKEKKARDPRKNEEVIVPAHKAVKFKMGKDMRDAL